MSDEEKTDDDDHQANGEESHPNQSDEIHSQGHSAQEEEQEEQEEIYDSSTNDDDTNNNNMAHQAIVCGESNHSNNEIDSQDHAAKEEENTENDEEVIPDEGDNSNLQLQEEVEKAKTEINTYNHCAVNTSATATYDNLGQPVSAAAAAAATATTENCQPTTNTNSSDKNSTTVTTKSSALRFSHATRRTMEELEAEKKYKALSSPDRNSNNAGTVTEESQPGAFAVGRASAHHTTSNTSAVVGNDGMEEAAETSFPEDSVQQEGERSEEEIGAPPSAASSHATADDESSGQQQHHGGNDNDNAPQEEEESAPMVVAELVDPPLHAMQVIFDEQDPEMAQHSTPNQSDHNQQRQEPTSSFSRDLFLCKQISHTHKAMILLVSVCILLIVILAIFIPLLSGKKSTEVPPSVATSTATMYPYDCFNSTRAMIHEQMKTPDKLLYIMCPNTTIQLGVLANALVNDTRFVQGDTPLVVLQPNVEVRCGLDGSVFNQCVLEGGFVQVLLQPIVPSEQEHGEVYTSGRTDNVTIRGLTFTGQLFQDIVFGGASIVISNPGHNVRLLDCRFENMTAPGGLIYVGTNPYQIMSSGSGGSGGGGGMLEPRAASVEIWNTTFRNIIYDKPLAEAHYQSLSLMGCQFANIRLSSFVAPCKNDQGPPIWCQNLLYCMGDSICQMQDVCLQDFEFAGNASLLGASPSAQISLSGSYFMEGVHPRSPSNHPPYTCVSGVSRIVETTHTVVCMDEEVVGRNWTAATTCPLA